MNQIDRHARFEPAADAPLEAVQDAFLAWAEEQDDRHELVGGKIVMMSPVNRAHAVLTVRIITALARQLDPDRYDVTGPDFGVRTSTGIRSPDVMVDRRDEAGHCAADAPTLIGEVLSPSSLAVDLVEKAAEYNALPSLQTYIVFAQDDPRAWVWQRDDEGRFPASPVMVAGGETVIAIDALGVGLPLGEIYRGLGA
jgi:Uma2 family endonuclease